MGRICISILTQVTHVWLIFSFLAGRHFGLVGIEAFVEGLGLPLAWSMAVLDVLLLLFSVFFLQIKSSLISLWSFCALFCTCYSIFVHFLCTFFMRFLRTFYALFMHFFMRFLCIFFCALKTRTKSVYTFLKSVCTFYALFKIIVLLWAPSPRHPQKAFS